MPCDVSCEDVDREHAVDFVKMVALFCRPLDVLTGHWKPSDHTVLACRDDPDNVSSQTFDITDWKPTTGFGDDGLVHAREELVGKRSTAFAGRGTINGEEKDLVIKLSYLSEDRRHHEQRVLRHIRDFPFDDLLERGRAGTIDLELSDDDVRELQRGCSRLPRYVGTLDFGEYARKQIDREDPETGVSETLYLSGLVTEGRPGTVIPSKTSCNDTLDVYTDAIACLWASSLCDVHYRDINQGNILQHPDGGGMAIDFGNATLRGTISRLDNTPEQLSKRMKDDSLATNDTFISVAAVKAGWRAKCFESSWVRLQADKDDPELEGEERLWRRKSYESVVSEVDRFRQPRFYDDVESIIWCLIHQVRGILSTAIAPFAYELHVGHGS